MFPLLVLLRLVILVVGIWFLATQIALPLANGTPPFPLFSRKHRKASRKVADVGEQLDVENLRALERKYRQRIQEQRAKNK